MKEKSVGKNAVLNMLKTVVTLIFPLLTFPYISRVLQVENLGKVNFANSVVNYFVLFATLGLKTYGIREGATVRNDREKFQKFFSEVFTLTIISTGLSLFVLAILCTVVPSLQNYRLLILLLSVSVVLPTFGCEWICSAYEDYGYITVRSILVQIISFVLIFALIHKPDDYYVYAMILVFSSQGANIFNLLYVRKYVKFRVTKNINLHIHLKPMMVLFASTLATSVYVSSSTTVLGLVCGDYYTGIYSAAAKLYSVMKNLVSAIVVVSIPRFAFYYNNNKRDEYNSLLNQISNTLALLVIPAATGVFLLSKEIILLISGAEYVAASSTLSILAIAVIFVGISWIMSQCILIPMKKEQVVLKTTLITAVLNIVLNIFLVGRWKHNAAAVTTLISETVVVLIYYYYVRKEVKIQGLLREIIKSFISSCVMGVVIVFGRNTNVNLIIKLPLLITISVLVYGSMLLILKDKYLLEYIHMVREKLANKIRT